MMDQIRAIAEVDADTTENEEFIGKIGTKISKTGKRIQEHEKSFDKQGEKNIDNERELASWAVQENELAKLREYFNSLQRIRAKHMKRREALKIERQEAVKHEAYLEHLHNYQTCLDRFLSRASSIYQDSKMETVHNFDTQISEMEDDKHPMSNLFNIIYKQDETSADNSVQGIREMAKNYGELIAGYETILKSLETVKDSLDSYVEYSDRVKHFIQTEKPKDVSNSRKPAVRVRNTRTSARKNDPWADVKNHPENYTEHDLRNMRQHTDNVRP